MRPPLSARLGLLKKGAWTREQQRFFLQTLGLCRGAAHAPLPPLLSQTHEERVFELTVRLERQRRAC